MSAGADSGTGAIGVHACSLFSLRLYSAGFSFHFGAKFKIYAAAAVNVYFALHLRRLWLLPGFPRLHSKPLADIVFAAERVVFSKGINDKSVFVVRR